MTDARDRRPYVRATVIRADRPASAHAGDTAVVGPDGTIDGFVGGSCAEASVRAESLRALATGESVVLTIAPPEDAAAVAVPGHITVPNPCLSGGTVEIFLEPVLPAPLVHVFGDAPIARALVEVGRALGYDVCPTTDPAGLAPDASAVVVASHGRDEEVVIRAALAAAVPYVGLVASRRRGTAVTAALGPEAARVRTPAGLDIGARTPGEVALSILAEIVAVRPRPGAPAADAPAPAVAARAVDPVCGMTVVAAPPSPAVVHDGANVWFCGPGCRDAFTDDPSRYGAGAHNLQG
jgi:xanthine dehydrogenase accessory factor